MPASSESRTGPNRLEAGWQSMRVWSDPAICVALAVQIDHVFAEKHGGQTVESNLALAGPHCHRFKRPNIAGLDPDSGQPIRLFHPRTDVWTQHFGF